MSKDAMTSSQGSANPRPNEVERSLSTKVIEKYIEDTDDCDDLANIIRQMMAHVPTLQLVQIAEKIL